MGVHAATQDLLLRMADDARLRRFIESKAVSHEIVRRYVAGESISSALDVAGELLARHRAVSITHLVADPLDRVQAQERRKRLRKVIRRLAQAGYTQGARVEVSVRLGALGAHLRPDGPALALEHARAIARSADEAGTRITLETEHGLDPDVTIDALRELRREQPGTGIALQAAMRRTEADCAVLAGDGVRVRLSKGVRAAQGGMDSAAGIDRAFVRAMQVLLESPGEPVIATHDRRLLTIAETLVERLGRPPGSVEYQLRYGVRPEYQAVVADRGDRLRVYVPFGEDWYPYLMSRVADEPGNLPALIRAATAR